MNRFQPITAVFRLILLSCFTFILVACGSNEPQPISFIMFGDPEELEAYQELVDTFQEAHPDIPVQLRHVPSQSEYNRQLAVEFSGGTPPNVMLINYRRFAQFAAAGGLEPLESYLAQSKTLQRENYHQTPFDGFTYQGQLWCIPQNVSSLVVYYNEAMFDAAGVPYPAEGWSREDFLNAARTLTQDTNGDGTPDHYGVGIEPTLIRLAPFIWQNGGEIVDDDENPTRLTLDTPEATAAFQWFVDLQVTEKVVPDATAESAESSESRFLNGTLAMYFDSRRVVPTLRTITAFQWDVVSLPGSTGEIGSILHSDAYCMSARTENKEAAWTFIEFANSAAGQQILAEIGRTVPSLKAVSESPAFLSPDKPPAHAQVFLDNIPLLRKVPTYPTWPSIEETVTKEIERAFYGQASVQEAIESANILTADFFTP